MSPQQRLYAYFGGSRKTAAERLGVTTETIRLWLRDGIPLNRSVWIEKKTEGFVTAEEVLRWTKKMS
jgi:DNA-binding transcriptional regulator YdaS (Cro superfamily)